MSLREKIAKRLVSQIVQNDINLDFPDFIKKIRMNLGISQSYVCRQAKIHYSKLYFFESKNKFKEPSDAELFLLADYYGIPGHMLVTKKNEYLGVI